MSSQHFPRPALAKQIADDLMGKNPWSDGANGMFLTAPRRTGKSDFLRLDLLPLLEKQGLVVVYVDLWADKNRPSMALIAEKLDEAVKKTLGVVGKAAQASGLDSINVLGVKIDTSKIGKVDGLTLHRVLELIHQQTGKKIVLMIDEAQHALTSEDGDMTLSALKSAREQMRTKGGNNLMLVLSGSHRDKLMQMLNTAATPFWGSKVQPLPTLGKPYVQSLAADLQRDHPQLLGLDANVMWEAFEQCGERPQFFKRDIVGAALASSQDAAAFTTAVKTLAKLQRERDRDGMTQIYLALAPLEQALLTHLMEMEAQFKPFNAAALAFYSQHMGEKVTAAQAQKALGNLRENDPPLVWKSLRGDYSLYDQEMAGWYAYLKGGHNWPPKRLS